MGILCLIGNLYIIALFARIILSWFPISPGGAVASIYDGLYRVTEPVLGPVRRVLPPVALGGMGLDLSPIIVLLVLRVILFPALGC